MFPGFFIVRDMSEFNLKLQSPTPYSRATATPISYRRKSVLDRAARFENPQPDSSTKICVGDAILGVSEELQAIPFSEKRAMFDDLSIRLSTNHIDCLH